MLDKLWELHERKMMLIIIFWWHWWNNRNKIREGELPIATSEIVRRAKCDAMKYEEVYSPSGKNTTARWQTPAQGEIKFNLDGAFTPGGSIGGWGVVARDHEGM